MALMRERDDLGERVKTVRTNASAPPPPAPEQPCIRTWEARLAKEEAHTNALEERLAVLGAAASRLSNDLAAEIDRRTAAEAELAALEAVWDASTPNATDAQKRVRFDDRAILYVGGRPRQVANLRRFVEGCGGRLLSHDGGVEDNLSLLAGLVGQADLVVFPTCCISHEATGQLKRSCESTAKPFYPVRSASLASFVRAVMPTAV